MGERLAHKLPPVITALAIQIAAFMLVNGAHQLFRLPLTGLALAASCGLVAALLSYLAGMAGWWPPMQLLFAPALLAMLSLQLPPGYFLLAFLAMLLVYWSTFRSQVPLYLSSKRVWQALEELLPPAVPGKRFSFIDIGSGIGGGLIRLARARPDGDFAGIENAPLPCFFSWLRIKAGAYANCSVSWGSFWDIDLSGYTLVYAYLSPVPMTQLWQKVQREMRPGSIFISNSFAISQQRPTYSITLEDRQHSTLHIWLIEQPADQPIEAQAVQPPRQQ